MHVQRYPTTVFWKHVIPFFALANTRFTICNSNTKFLCAHETIVSSTDLQWIRVLILCFEGTLFFSSMLEFLFYFLVTLEPLNFVSDNLKKIHRRCLRFSLLLFQWQQQIFELWKKTYTSYMVMNKKMKLKSRLSMQTITRVANPILVLFCRLRKSHF